jgi:hypothetical protein
MDSAVAEAFGDAVDLDVAQHPIGGDGLEDADGVVEAGAAAQRPSAWPMPDGTQSATMARPGAERSRSRGRRIHNAGAIGAGRAVAVRAVAAARDAQLP